MSPPPPLLLEAGNGLMESNIYNPDSFLLLCLPFFPFLIPYSVFAFLFVLSFPVVSVPKQGVRKRGVSLSNPFLMRQPNPSLASSGVSTLPIGVVYSHYLLSPAGVVQEEAVGQERGREGEVVVSISTPRNKVESEFLPYCSSSSSSSRNSGQIDFISLSSLSAVVGFPSSPSLCPLPADSKQERGKITRPFLKSHDKTRQKDCFQASKDIENSIKVSLKQGCCREGDRAQRSERDQALA
ncbi:acetyl-coenzyme A carboxylase carboxyltransferase subunit beta [Striga asiatica]|uniref:Acetyl-coenzyme A carboxylase carboxyltransferase subunit beta n=1 Tax=Striga asiatica TaxID=4170 RepID=A0A5A7Q073_STRAF|nr:acetyl-coenzyme A carboxylase carboxyltransferase subunit beta [Striga asiatica]